MLLFENQFTEIYSSTRIAFDLKILRHCDRNLAPFYIA